MMPSLGFLAALGLDLPKQTRPFGKVPSLLLSDVLLIIGVGLALLLALTASIYAWMRWRRNRRRHVSGGEKVFRDSSRDDETSPEEEPARNHARHDHPEDDSESDDDRESDEHGSHRRRRYKYRVRRRTHRSRNPTLSETGGLPPVKTSEPGKSS